MSSAAVPEFGPNDWFVEEKYQQFLADPRERGPDLARLLRRHGFRACADRSEHAAGVSGNGAGPAAAGGTSNGTANNTGTGTNGSASSISVHPDSSAADSEGATPIPMTSPARPSASATSPAPAARPIQERRRRAAPRRPRGRPGRPEPRPPSHRRRPPRPPPVTGRRQGIDGHRTAGHPAGPAHHHGHPRRHGRGEGGEGRAGRAGRRGDGLTTTPLRGVAAAVVKNMTSLARGADRDLGPRGPGQVDGRQPDRDQQLPQAEPRREDLLHPPDRVRHRPGDRRLPEHEPALRGRGRQAVDASRRRT